MRSGPRWWQKTTVYQIYPRSFKDSNGDGVGDLPGIISQLDYIRELGFETLWISPFFPSPQADGGYDISDYCDVAPEYGTLADADTLIHEVHRRGMRVLFDLVMNHSSDQHPWFQGSRSSSNHPQRDWYIWRRGRGRRPPNNWKAIPGGSGWHYDPHSGEWYYASFMPFQPDLDYRNPAVKEAMFDVARFWLDRGVDGFRLDIFHSIFKDAEFRDNPFSLRFAPNQEMTAGFFQRWRYNLNRPESWQLAHELRALLQGYAPERMLLGELFGEPHILKRYLGEKGRGLNLVFLWDLLELKMTANFFRELLRRYEKHYPRPYTPVTVLGNHDNRRSIARVGNDPAQAKLLALLQFTVRGVPVTYYGEEIGMRESQLPAGSALDPVGRRYRWVPGWLAELLGLYLNRDGCRTPMQWTPGENAGFCQPGIRPWLPLPGDQASVNVASQWKDPGSLLNTYRALLQLRKGHPTLQEGSLELLEAEESGKELLAYRRVGANEAILVVINVSGRPQRFENRSGPLRPLYWVGMEKPARPEKPTLPPYSGLVLSDHEG